MKIQTHVKGKLYDCMECGQKNSVLVTDDYGFCRTPGCLHQDRIQYVFFPSWMKPKICRAGRNVFF